MGIRFIVKSRIYHDSELTELDELRYCESE
jgi:hypothetical protein